MAGWLFPAPGTPGGLVHVGVGHDVGDPEPAARAQHEPSAGPQQLAPLPAACSAAAA
jgi:hypothetical protein